MENPLLIDGHKFDINFFVGIASVNPLRVYYYEKNTHFRFCKLPYDHNNFSDTDTYVIADDHIMGNDFKAFEKYMKMNYSYKEAFNTIMREKGIDSQIIYDQVEDCIRTILLQKEQQIINEIQRLKPSYGKYHFFELVRFDFLVDDKLKLHLMEVNMSPNLQATARLTANKKLFERVIYNFLNLVGVGTYFKNTKIHSFAELERSILGDVDQISVKPEVCTAKLCQDSCDAPECQLCQKCLSETMKWDLMVAYMEHMNIGEMKRVVPPPKVRCCGIVKIFSTIQRSFKIINFFF